jgi:hypothetical protein
MRILSSVRGSGREGPLLTSPSGMDGRWHRFRLRCAYQDPRREFLIGNGPQPLGKDYGDDEKDGVVIPHITMVERLHGSYAEPP